ncbi:unnamed protein product, partial [Phaeothamnion confervicola]
MATMQSCAGWAALLLVAALGFLVAGQRELAVLKGALDSGARDDATAVRIDGAAADPGVGRRRDGATERMLETSPLSAPAAAAWERAQDTPAAPGQRRRKRRSLGGRVEAEPEKAPRCYHSLPGLPLRAPHAQTCCWLPQTVSLVTAANAGGNVSAGSLPSLWWKVPQSAGGGPPAATEAETGVLHARHCLPSFIIAGTQKSGSTALAAILERHPSVRMSVRKELHYFDQPDNVRRGLPFYSGHFPSVDAPEYIRPGDPPLPPPPRRPLEGLSTYASANGGGLGSDSDGRQIPIFGDMFVTGEATPYYMASRDACKNMAALVPDVRLIVLMREPVERAYSEYQMKLRRVDDQDAFFTEVRAQAELAHDCFFQTARAPKPDPAENAENAEAAAEDETASGGLLTIDHLSRWTRCVGALGEQPKWLDFTRPLFERMATAARRTAAAVEKARNATANATPNGGGMGGDGMGGGVGAGMRHHHLGGRVGGGRAGGGSRFGGGRALEERGEAERATVKGGEGSEESGFAATDSGEDQANGRKADGGRWRRRLAAVPQKGQISMLEARARAATATNVIAKCFPIMNGKTSTSGAARKDGDNDDERQRLGPRRLLGRPAVHESNGTWEAEFFDSWYGEYIDDGADNEGLGFDRYFDSGSDGGLDAPYEDEKDEEELGAGEDAVDAASPQTAAMRRQRDRDRRRRDRRQLLTVWRNGKLVRSPNLPGLDEAAAAGRGGAGGAAAPLRVLPPQYGLARRFEERCYLKTEARPDLRPVMLKEATYLSECFDNATAGALSAAAAAAGGTGSYSGGGGGAWAGGDYGFGV